jgi:hypothetical protein
MRKRSNPNAPNLPLTEDDKLWINEQLERVETSLLTEFHKWASPIGSPDAEPGITHQLAS